MINKLNKTSYLRHHNVFVRLITREPKLHFHLCTDCGLCGYLFFYGKRTQIRVPNIHGVCLPIASNGKYVFRIVKL